jgi:AraC-like DNA-binding protein
MSKTVHPEHQIFSDSSKAFEGDAADYRRLFEALSQRVPAAQILLISTFPRGGTQILQPTQVPDGFLRSYSRESFAVDAPTWRAVLGRKAVAGSDCVDQDTLEASPYFHQMMAPFGLGQLAVAPVKDPVFRGYPGALHVYRKAGERAFTAEELRTLIQAADELGQLIEANRDARIEAACGEIQPWEQVGPTRQFIFNRKGEQVAVYKDAQPLDERLQQSVRQLVTERVQSAEAEAVTSDRVEFQDNNGEVWAFRTTTYRSFPALGEGPYVFLCLQPPACEWEVVKPTDFAADQEVSRLIPTLKFMQAEFHRTPTLDEIAAKAHLSPFHFHRRFTELLGQTPKHYLLACQIRAAKRMLMERKVPLAEIAAQCGFAHQSHFTSRFKQATGLTPTRWRRFAGEQQEGATAGAGASSAV